jgi:hypothetical protein
MSSHSHSSDRAAAYRGLILGAIVLAIIIVSIVKMTNAKYEGEAGAKKAAVTSSQVRANGALDV